MEVKNLNKIVSKVIEMRDILEIEKVRKRKEED